MINGRYEDIEVGDQTRTSARTVTESDIVTFAGLSGDWHPLHTDIEYAKSGPFGERISHGMLALSILTGLVHIDREHVLAFYGIDRLRFVSPVRIHDTIHAETSIVNKQPRDERCGSVDVEASLVNQRGEIVLAATLKFLVSTEDVPDRLGSSAS